MGFARAQPILRATSFTEPIWLTSTPSSASHLSVRILVVNVVKEVSAFGVGIEKVDISLLWNVVVGVCLSAREGDVQLVGPLVVFDSMDHRRLDLRHLCSLPFAQLHPVVPPQVSHFRQVPLRTSVKLPHSPQASPS